LRNFENFLNTYFNPYKKGGTLEYKTGALTKEAKEIIDNYVLKTIRTKTPDAYFDSALRGYSRS
jgi:RecJ-like exonuclease